ncbi:MAG: hypothetical protein E7B53_19730 [Clostridium sp.]|uniref:hypothetical protein n=1 Tax=Clostridium sp. TaxID=1506 RepID=UPI0029012ABD|nr:hypothetical protein [Clostridium sp.]MDU2896987.1 hypothetical protein [Clostridium sp.]MDU3009161.1 hypothetical protein [Clostridium sp.]MDU3039315.1 hypothetical protein [Clostridium sp.]MDU3053346.1 hypothetical protein [Clostridium sp.]
MRLIKNEKQLQLLSFTKIIDIKLTYEINKILEEFKEKYESFAGILILEEGDLLRGIDVLGINSNIGGVIGIKFLKVKFIGEYILGVYRYNDKLVYLIINKKYCDNEILYLFNIYS